MPVKDMKLLRDQLAKMISENRHPETRLDEANEKNAEQALTVDRLTMELSLAPAKLEEALAMAAKLEAILRRWSGDRAQARKWAVADVLTQEG